MLPTQTNRIFLNTNAGPRADWFQWSRSAVRPGRAQAYPMKPDAAARQRGPLAHVGIDHQHPLPGLGDHRGKVGGDEGLAHARTRTGDGEDVVLCLQHGEVQAGAQAAQRLHRQVRRLVDGQQVLAAVGADMVHTQAVTLGRRQRLGVAQRDGRIDRQAQLLDHGRVLDARVEHALDEHEGDGKECAQHRRHQHHKRLARFDRVGGVSHGRIDDAHIAHRARARHIQLLGLVQQGGIELVADLQVAGQAQQFLLGIRQLADLAAEAGLACLQLANLAQQGTVGRVIAGKAAIHLRLLQAQLLDAGFNRDLLLQQALGLHGDVHGVGRGLVTGHGLLRFLHLLAHGGQLVLDELQLGSRLGRAALDVLADIGLNDLLHYSFSARRIGIFVGDKENAGFLALLRNIDVLLQSGHDVQATSLDDLEPHARIGMEGRDFGQHGATLCGLARPAPHQFIAVFITQYVSALIVEHLKGQLAIDKSLRHLQTLELKGFPSPAKAIQGR